MKTWQPVVRSSILVALLFSGCASHKEAALQTFIDNHVAKVRPLAIQSNLADWEAATTGKSEAYDRSGQLRLKIRQVYSDANDYAYLKSVKASGQVRDPLLSRQLDVLVNAYLENQIDPDLLKEIVDLGTRIEEKFSTHRADLDGQKVTDNRIKEILKAETDSAKRERTWLASKQVGQVVAGDLVRLVKLRNQAARKLGFNNYHTLSLTIAEQDVNELDRIFEDLYERTKEPYARLKAEIDASLARKWGIEPGQMRPWHYQDPFFQDTPAIYDLDLDVFYKDKDVKQLAVTFYDGIGLPIESILARSDLYERDGKNPHAFCTHMDREGDIRILCNLKDNERWMETILHESGHGVYEKFLDIKMPYLLRQPAHIFTTEAIAMLFGRLSGDPAWMQAMLNLSDSQKAEIEQVSGRYAQLKQLVFARWDMVMYNFEKQLYANPDQDLNRLWWDLVEKYQLIRRPEGRNQPDWAAKIHFTIAPCYYHNYMLGELLASQLNHTIVIQVLKQPEGTQVTYVGHRPIGDFLRKKVFEAGAKYPWNEMIRRATGEPLTAKYFVGQFVAQ
jgi:peptidyl-dipeptidase A